MFIYKGKIRQIRQKEPKQASQMLLKIIKARQYIGATIMDITKLQQNSNHKDKPVATIMHFQSGCSA